MGFFDGAKNETCSICGEKFLACYNLKDKNKICKNCIKKIGGYWTSGWTEMTREQAIEAIKGNETIMCPICRKNEIHRKEKICDSCKINVLRDMQYHQETINRVSKDIAKGYKNLDSYLSRYKLILDEFKEVYKMKDYVSENVQLDPDTYEECTQKYLEKIKEIIDEKKKIIIHKLQITGESQFEKELRKLRDEILEMQVKYPEFESILTISDIQEVLK